MKWAATVAAALTLAACGPADPPLDREGGETVACAPGGLPDLTERCAVTRERTAAGLVLVLTAPSGGFRRLLVTRDGRGVVAADGAEAASVTIVAPGLIDVAVGDDRYRLPASTG